MAYIIFLLCLFVRFSTVVCGTNIKPRPFPPNFRFGATTSAYQIEGGWNEDEKSCSIWDVATHSKNTPVLDKSNGDVAADSYHRYKRDIDMMKELGLQYYHFSISWTRILPNGFIDKINKRGINYYNDLINDMLKEGIQPFVTIFHWDLPHHLQTIGGWANPAMVPIFRDYARVLFSKFGDRVKHWITVSEPNDFCRDGYGTGTLPPMVNVSGIAEYMCAKNILLAHAHVYNDYKVEFKGIQNGTVGISISHTWYEPSSQAKDDEDAAKDARQFDWGLFDHPIFSEKGDFPKDMRRNIDQKSVEQGFLRTRFGELTKMEVKLIKGSSDFLGVSAFTTKMVYRDASLEELYKVPSYMDDLGAVITKDVIWSQAASSWLHDVPWGFFKLFLELKKLYANPPIYVMKNGWSTTGGLLDENRISYMKNYLNALLDAIDEGCDIRGYFMYSLMDGFQWKAGYKEKFGLYEVDFINHEKTRTPRKSAFVYKEIIKSKSLDMNFEPDSFVAYGRGD